MQRGPANCLISRCRVTLTINRSNLFLYDPTHDPYETYLDTGTLGAVSDPDASEPTETGTEWTRLAPHWRDRMSIVNV